MPFAFLCTATTFDPFVLGVALWAALQLTGTVILLVAQAWQIMPIDFTIFCKYYMEEAGMNIDRSIINIKPPRL